MKLILVILFIFIFIVGLYVILKISIYAFSMRHWLQTNASITACGLKDDSGGAEIGGFCSPDGIVANIQTHYKYSVNGVEYDNTYISVMDFARPFVLNYDKYIYKDISKNKSTTIWYNPKNPGKSVITRKFYFGRFIMFVSLTAFGLIGACITFKLYF